MGLEASTQAGALAAVVTLIVAAVGAPAATPTADDASPQRLIVTKLGSLEAELGDALATVDGELVRVDERLDFAVVRAPYQPLADRLGDHVVPDERVAGPMSSPSFADAGAGEAGGMPDDPRNGEQWALSFLDMPSAWALETGSADVTVAVVDSGLDVDHEDLAGLPVELGTDYVDGGTVSDDPHGHGTHITGILAAERGNGVGITGMAEVSLMNVRVLDGDNRGWCSDFYSGIAEAAEEGADVINFSIGGFCLALNLVDMHATLTSNDALLVGITHNYWEDGHPFGVANCLFVNQLDAYPNVMAVTAIDRNGEVTHFSCRAPWADVAAPGADVLSTLPGDRYGSWYGTSMAAPHVAATAALMKSANPDLGAQETRALLVGTADDAGQRGWDPAYGHGILDPVEALEAANPADLVP